MKLPTHFLRKRLVQNILALYGVQVARYILPFITIPYLARVLGPSAWGMVAFTQAFAMYIGLVAEYGFDLSATREAARSRDDKRGLSELLAGVLGAKVLLALLAMAVALVVQPYITVFREYPLLFRMGLFWALAQAFNMLWFYQGLERMKLVAALDIITKILAVTGILLFIHAPGDEWKVLAFQGAAATVTFLVSSLLAYREIPFSFPTILLAWRTLRTGWSLFLIRGGASLYTAGNAFILGLFVPVEFVGYYAGAEKITRAARELLRPVTVALYPRLSYMVQHARDDAARYVRVLLVGMGGGGALIGLLLFVFAPQVVSVILGAGFSPAVPALRILAALPFLASLSQVLGIQWMLPHGLDRPLVAIVLTAGMVSLGLALLLAPRFAHIGMAWAAVASEAFVTMTCYAVLRLRNLDPFNRSFRVREKG